MKKEPAKTKLIKTSSFTLAIYGRGDRNSDRVALVLPGRLDTKDYVHMRSHVDLLGALGFCAFSFDPPFSWESPGDIANYSTTNYIKAVNEVIEHFGSRPTLLVGHSRGGSVAMLASDNPNVMGVVPIMATYGAPSAPSGEETKTGEYTTTRDLPPGDVKTSEQKKFTLPLNYFEDGQKYNPTGALMRYKGPKLLIYGSQDSFTGPERVKEVFDQLSEPKMLVELNSRHDYRLDAESLQKANDAIEEFVKKYL